MTQSITEVKMTGTSLALVIADVEKFSKLSQLEDKVNTAMVKWLETHTKDDKDYGVVKRAVEQGLWFVVGPVRLDDSNLDCLKDLYRGATIHMGARSPHVGKEAMREKRIARLEEQLAEVIAQKTAIEKKLADLRGGAEGSGGGPWYF